MLVTDDRLVAGRDLVALTLAAERGGASAVQLRLKEATPRLQAELARALIAALRIPVLINDRTDIALAAGAAGVHLGPDDMAAALARRIAPPGFIIGLSVGSAEEADSAAEADYWGVGPWRATSTKADAGPSLGAGGFAAIVGRAGPAPCLAIGAVRVDDVSDVLAAGGMGVAVASGILATADVTAAARAYSDALG